MTTKINIAIVGATGFTGLDLVYLLSNHPKVNIKYLCATKNLGKKISYFDKRIKKRLINLNSITIDSKSGYSGAGKGFEKKFTHKNLFHSVHAYSTKNHRHISEIDQEIKKMTGKSINFSFNPHLLPTYRGILSSIYVYTKKNCTPNKIRNEIKKYYKGSKFIKILKLNSQLGSGNVLNTNNLEISVCETRVKNKVLILSSIDNLVKGASGQAIQNMNVLFNYKENLGLK